MYRLGFFSSQVLEILEHKKRFYKKNVVQKVIAVLCSFVCMSFDKLCIFPLIFDNREQVF